MPSEDETPPPETIVIVTAYNEADRLPATLAALDDAFPNARIVVADDGSADDSATVALHAGAEVVRAPRTIGKGGVATMAAERVMDAVRVPDPPVVVLCDGDLGASAAQLVPLADAVRAGETDLAIGNFLRRVGGGFGLALNAGRWAARRRGGIALQAPLSGQRALRGDMLPHLTPFGARFGMETAMNIDAARRGYRIREYPLELEHRATGRTLKGFIHRGRQLADILAAYVSRR